MTGIAMTASKPTTGPLYGYLTNIQHFSVHDGDGIRTTFFFAGCPLACRWCANPETASLKKAILFYPDKCQACQACRAVCPYPGGLDLSLAQDRARCQGCGLCATACPTGARRPTISAYTVEDLVQAVLPYQSFFTASGGGVTYSGGECTGQAAFLDQLSRRFYDLAISQAMETCGYFDFDRLWPTLTRLDLVFFDLKHMDPARHRQLTGQDNRLIQDNFKRLAARQENIIVRVPLLQGVNDDPTHIRRLAQFVARYAQLPKIEVLPYHALGRDKAQALGQDQPLYQPPDQAHIQALKAVIRQAGCDPVSLS
ncbi:glycyl-radical enzyme activating protein [Peptococcus simiae]|uniref:glycyl-radical enzyme activating protein n=1 Tax=Peptococcus simiae TaxID=1643805 RepID=UPI003980F28C